MLLKGQAASDLNRRRQAELRRQMAMRDDALRKQIAISEDGAESRYSVPAQMEALDDQTARLESDIVRTIEEGRQPLDADKAYQGDESTAYTAARARGAADTLDRARRMSRLRAAMQAPGAARFERGIGDANDRLTQSMIGSDTARAVDVSNTKIAGMQPSGLLTGIADVLGAAGQFAAGQALSSQLAGVFGSGLPDMSSAAKVGSNSLAKSFNYLEPGYA